MCTAAARIGELVEVLHEAGPAGFAIGLHLTFTTPRYLFQSYPPAWQDIYTRKGYLMRDPTVHWGLANEGWIDWSDLCGHDPDGVIGEAAGHGMRHGVTISVADRGSRSIASFARADRGFAGEEADAIQARVRELHDLTLNVHALPASLHDLLRRLSIILTRG